MRTINKKTSEKQKMEKNAKSKEKLNLYEVKNKYTRKKINKNNNNKERIRKEQSDK